MAESTHTGVGGEELMSITGIGKGYARLLEAAGVHSVRDLSRRDPLLLADALLEASLVTDSVRVVPMERRVAGWIKQAKGLGKPAGG